MKEMESGAKCMLDFKSPIQGLLHIVLQPISGIALSGGSPRAVRSIFSAITLARALNIPSVQPETCGVMITLLKLWNGSVDGATFPALVGYLYQTSSAAPANRPSASAPESTLSSTISARATLIKYADGFMRPSRRASIKPRVSGESERVTAR